MSGYHWLEELDYQKAEGQLRLQLNGVFEPFKCYGLDIYIPGAIEEIMHLSRQFGKRVRGKDAPIIARSEPRRRDTEW